MSTHTPPAPSDPDKPARRPRWQHVALWGLVCVALLAVALTVDFGRQAAAGPDLVPWEEGFARGQAEARRTGKPMLVNFTADWCVPCQQMKATVFSQPRVADQITDHFVPVRVDFTSPEPGGPEEQVGQRYSVMGYPTYMVIAPDGEAVSTRLGPQTDEALLGWLQAVR